MMNIDIIGTVDYFDTIIVLLCHKSTIISHTNYMRDFPERALNMLRALSRLRFQHDVLVLSGEPRGLKLLGSGVVLKKVPTSEGEKRPLSAAMNA